MNLRTQAVVLDRRARSLLLLFLWVFSDILLPFILGMALAYLLDPLADRLERAGMSRFWATITIVVLTVLVLALVALVVVPLLWSRSLPASSSGCRPTSTRAAGARQPLLPDADRPVFPDAGRRPERRSDGVAGRLLDRHRARLGLGRRAGADQRRQPDRRDAGRRLLPALRLGPHARPRRRAAAARARRDDPHASGATSTSRSPASSAGRARSA